LHGALVRGRAHLLLLRQLLSDVDRSPPTPGLVFKAQRLVYHSTQGFRVIKKKKKKKKKHLLLLRKLLSDVERSTPNPKA